MRLRDFVVAIELREFLFDRWCGVHHLAQVADLGFVLRDRGIERRNLDVRGIELRLDALVHRVRAQRSDGARARAALGEVGQLGLFAQLQLVDLAAQRNHLWMLVSEFQQQILQFPFRIEPTRRDVRRWRSGGRAGVRSRSSARHIRV